MPTPLPLASNDPSRNWDGPQRWAVVIAALGALGIGSAALALPPPLLLPFASVMAVGMAAATAIQARRRAERPRPDRFGYWDLSGALALIGICAALLGDPEQAIPLFEAARNG